MTAGAVHRLAWLGEGEDRRRALVWFRHAGEVLGQARPALGAVLDWWRVAALGDIPVGRAWTIDRVGLEELGDALKSFLAHGRARPLDAVRRPVIRERVQAELERIILGNPGKVAADKAILGEAIGDCRQVVRALKEGREFPEGLRLAESSPEDLQAWASEDRRGNRLEPNSPVFNHAVKLLEEQFELVRRVREVWPGDAPPTPELPEDWQQQLRDSVGEEGCEVVAPLVADALQEPGGRPSLEPSAVLELEVLPGPAGFWATLAREAADTAEVLLPEWAEAPVARLEALEGGLCEFGCPTEDEVAEALEVVRDALGWGRLEDAELWIEQAKADRRAQAGAAEADRVKALAEERATQLRALGTSVARADDGAAWAAAVESAFADARSGLEQRLNRIHERANWPGGDRDEVRGQLSLVREHLAKQQLPEAASQLKEAKAALERKLARDEERLGRRRWALLERVSELDVAAGRAVAVGVEWSWRREQAGLADIRLSPIERLVDSLERGEAVGVVAGEAGAAWAEAGILAPSAEAEGSSNIGPWGLRHHAGAKTSDTGRWGLCTSEAPENAPGPVYLREGDQVSGPWRARASTLEPWEDYQAVASMPGPRFDELFGALGLLPNSTLVPTPPDVHTMVRAGGEVVDQMGADVIAGWLAEQLEGMPPMSSLEAFVLTARRVPEPVRRHRLERLEGLLAHARALDAMRASAVRGFLSSPAGRTEVEAAADRLAEQERGRIEAATEAKRAELAAVEEEIETARGLLDDEKSALLIGLMGQTGWGGRTPPTPPEAPTPELTPARAPAPVPESPIRARAFTARALPGLKEVVREVSGQPWSEDAVANLVLSMATGRWTLMAGLPGVGKSTFARSVLTRLGHGPSTERYLELVVRRDWQDDAPLFGFWHPTERRWVGSSEGLLEQLLRAADGAEQDGIWPVLVEELNLASPEYYLARLLSAFEAAQPTLRLFDPELAREGSLRYPPRVALSEGVRMLGTVNVDDTVERLSPRFLSRASVLWFQPSTEAEPWTPDSDERGLSVPWSNLVCEREPAELGGVEAIMRFLAEERVAGAPTTRTRLAIGSYLAAARGVMDPKRAEDLQVLQRILPPLRGVGPRWRGLLDRLILLLEDHDLSSSAARARDLRERGEELGDWYDFFHT